jgi:hypothetical protein
MLSGQVNLIEMIDIFRLKCSLTGALRILGFCGRIAGLQYARIPGVDEGYSFTIGKVARTGGFPEKIVDAYAPNISSVSMYHF